MTGTELPPVRPARPEWREGTPYAPKFGDGYFSSAGGAAESLHVFIRGNRLPERFAALDAGSAFVVGETGFGTGLNMLLAADCFGKHAPSGARLHLLSAEKHPLIDADLRLATASWTGAPELAERLIAGYPPAAAGYHRIRLAANVDLTLMLGDAETMWRLNRSAVDAWFLDGFAPSRNPEMWSAGLFRELARRSRPGATLATFSVAGRVRRGLTEAGFRLHRRPGFGGKRECLGGQFRGDHPGPSWRRSGRVLVAGAGLAGATTARALAERGWQVTVLDPAGSPRSGGGNPAAVLHANPAARLHPQNRFYLASYLRTLQWMRTLDFPDLPEAGALAGMEQHLVDRRRRRKVLEALETGAWPELVAMRIGEDRVRFPEAGWVVPEAWCRRLLDHPAIRLHTSRLERLQFGSGHGPVDALVVCTGAGSRQLPGLEHLPLRLIRGQVTLCRATNRSRAWRSVHCHSGYLTPAFAGRHAVGATFDRDYVDPSPREDDDRANLEALAAGLPGHWEALGGRNTQVVGHWAGLRCQTPDFLPLCGPREGLDDRIYLNLGHGSRGLTNTPLCADLVADRLSRLPVSVDAEVEQALLPGRRQAHAQ